MSQQNRNELGRLEATIASLNEQDINSHARWRELEARLHDREEALRTEQANANEKDANYKNKKPNYVRLERTSIPNSVSLAIIRNNKLGISNTPTTSCPNYRPKSSACANRPVDRSPCATSSN